jgi:hypothetical protein
VRSPRQFRPLGAATVAFESTFGLAASVVFGAASALRGARVFHPDGIAFSATVDVGGEGRFGAPLLDEPGRYSAVVRVSRGAGVREPLPDILGLAIRIEDAHGANAPQDLLMVSSWRRPVLRHALVPVTGFQHEQWSAVLPYRVADRTVLFGATRLDAPPDSRVTLGDVESAVVRGDRVEFALQIAGPWSDWEQFARLTLDGPLPEIESARLRYNPANAGGGIEPVGVLQSFRRMSYIASQSARAT